VAYPAAGGLIVGRECQIVFVEGRIRFSIKHVHALGSRWISLVGLDNAGGRSIFEFVPVYVLKAILAIAFYDAGPIR
jgi:hypothetical protein